MILKGVDQLNAKLIERIYEGGDRKELLDLMFKARRGEINADSFEPDTSILPPGIYPGQQLYYVHIETIGLGIFTLNNIKNRIFKTRAKWLTLSTVFHAGSNMEMTSLLFNANRSHIAASIQSTKLEKSKTMKPLKCSMIPRVRSDSIKKNFSYIFIASYKRYIIKRLWTIFQGVTTIFSSFTTTNFHSKFNRSQNSPPP